MQVPYCTSAIENSNIQLNAKPFSDRLLLQIRGPDNVAEQGTVTAESNDDPALRSPKI